MNKFVEGECPKCHGTMEIISGEVTRYECVHCQRIYIPSFKFIGYRVTASNEFVYGKRIYLAAPSEPSASLRKAMTTMTCFIPNLTSKERKALVDAILFTVESVVKAMKELLQEAVDHRIDDAWLKKARILIGREE